MPPRLARAPQGAHRPNAAEPIRIEVAPLHELLAVDRRGAGEKRSAEARRELATATYSMPLRVQWRRAFRRHRRLRVTTWSLGLSILTAILLWQGPRLGAQLGGAIDWAKPRLSAQLGKAADWAKPWLSAQLGGAIDWAKPWLSAQLGGAIDWAESATGTADPLWLHTSSAGELRASERAPRP